MSIIETIESQLNGDAIGKLSGLIGEDEQTTRSAVKIAVPTILAALGNQASSGDGAKKIASMLETYDPNAPGNLISMFSGQGGTILDRGSTMLNSVLSGGVLSSIVSAISRFTNMGAGGVQKLLGAIMPMVTGALASQFRGKTISPQGISSFFTSQMPEITRALPAGFSLASIPGLSRATAGVPDAAEMAQDAGRSTAPFSNRQTNVYRRDPVGASTASAARWILPLVGLALIALLAWNFIGRRPAEPTRPMATTTTPAPRVATPSGDTVPPARKDTVLTSFRPEATALASELSNAYADATSIMSQVTDAASAEAAVPKLREVNQEIDTLRANWDALSDSARPTVGSVTARELPEFKDEVNRLLTIPGVADVLRPVLDDTVAKLTSFRE